MDPAPHASSMAHVPDDRSADGGEPETFNPWSIVNVVFHHLADQGLHPVLGGSGDPGRPAADLLLALGVQPAAEGNRAVREGIREHLGTLRTTVLGER